MRTLRNLAILLALFCGSSALGETMIFSARVVDRSGKPISGENAFKVELCLTSYCSAPVFSTTMNSVKVKNGVFQFSLTLSSSDFSTAFPGPATTTYYRITDMTNSPNAPFEAQAIAVLPYAYRIPIDSSQFKWDSSGQLALLSGAGSSSGGTGSFSNVIAASSSAATTALVVSGASGQSSNLADFRNSSGSTLFAIDPSGIAKFLGPGTSYFMGMKAATGMTANVTYTFPAAPVAGGFLQTDASGNLSWANTGGSTAASSVTGLTTGSIAFASATGLTESNAQLFWDNTNNRLGVGTNAPATALHVAGDLRLQNIRTYGMTRTLPTTVNDYINLGSLAFTSGGANLTVKVSASGFSASKTYFIALSDDQTSGGWKKVAPLVDSYASGDDFALDINVSTTTATLRLRRTGGSTAGTAYVAIYHEGNLGDAFTASSTTGSVAAPAGYLNTSLLTMNPAGIQTYGKLFLAADPASALEAATKQYVDNALAGGSTNFSTTGSLGVGTTSPASKLEIKGAGASSATSALNVTDSAGSSKFFVRDDGKVGIGTTSPAATLDVGGDVYVGTGTNTTASGLTFRGASWNGTIYPLTTNILGVSTRFSVNAGTVGAPGLSTTGDTDTGLWFPAANNLAIVSGGAERMRFDGSGNVGIGITNPTAKLDVNGTIRSGASGFAITRPTDSANMSALSAPTYDNLVVGGGNQSRVTLRAHTTDVLTANTSGNVGIGTTSPAGTLQIASGQILAPDGSSTAPSYSFGSSTGQGMYRLGSSAVGIMAQSSYLGAHIGPSRLGISQELTLSNNAPAAPDTFLGRESAATFRLGAAAAAAPVAQTLKAQDGSGTDIGGASLTIGGGKGTGTGAGGALVFQTAPAGGSSGTTANSLSERMRISSAGNVGIGTTSPSTLLTLLGGNTITFTGVSAQNQTSTISTDSSDNMIFNFGGGSGKTFQVKAGSTVLQLSAPSNGHTLSGNLTITPAAANLKAITLKAVASATANLQEWLNSSSHILASMGPQSSTDQRQQFFLYNTLETAPTNYERLALYPDSTNNIFRIESQNGGTGTLRNLVMQASSGKVGIGTTSPSYKLDVSGDTRIVGSSQICTIGDVSGVSCTSDQRLKENISPIKNALAKILSVRGVEYDWNDKARAPGKHQIGVIAQEIQKTFPESVTKLKGEEGYLTVDYASLVAPLIEAVREVWGHVSEIIGRLDNHDSEINELKNQVSELKAYICAKDPATPLCHSASN